jgi:hypothetical protein
LQIACYFRFCGRLAKLLQVYISHHVKVIAIYAVPDGHNEKTEFEVFKFKGAGGVALSMYNTDEVLILFFFVSFFSFVFLSFPFL